MARILFIVSAHTGHIHATFRVAKRLVARGHIVTYAGPEAARTTVAEQGVAFISSEMLESADQWASCNGVAGRWSASALEAYAGWIVSQARTLIDAVSPDLLVFDPFALVYFIAFWPQRVRAVVLSANVLLDPDPLVPPYTSSVIPTGGILGRASVQAAWARSWIDHATHSLRFTFERVVHGYSDQHLAQLLARVTGFPLADEYIARSVYYDLCLRSVPELVLWPARYDFPRARPLRAFVRYVGPSIELDRTQRDLDWNLVPRARSLVYCALGTVELPHLIARRREFLRSAVHAFRSLRDCALVVATGKAIAPEELGALPSNVVAWRDVPQLSVLRRADLFITHGGANSIKEAILSAVPMLVFPRRADQFGNAARIVFHGLGRRGHAEAARPSIVARAVSHVLSSSGYRERIRRMRDVFIEDDDRELDADAIEAELQA